MDLLAKALIVVIAMVALFGAAFYLFSSGVFGRQVTKQQAVSQVYYYLQSANPGAQINITNVTPSQFTGSWHILASVVLNATSPCPSYYIYSFDYPKFGFVQDVQSTYTDNCSIYSGSGNTLIIASGPAAITQSYDLHIPAVMDFVQKYGYSNVKVYADYYGSIGYTGVNYTDVWLVNYTSPRANSSVRVLVFTNGSYVK